MRALLLIASLMPITTVAAQSKCVATDDGTTMVRSWIETDLKVARETKSTAERAFSLGNSWIEKTTTRMGDELSVIILRAYIDDELRDEERLTYILSYLDTAFSEAAAISCDQYRSPRVTLLLLEHIRENTKSAKIRSKVDELSRKLQVIRPEK